MLCPVRILGAMLPIADRYVAPGLSLAALLRHRHFLRGAHSETCRSRERRYITAALKIRGSFVGAQHCCARFGTTSTRHVRNPASEPPGIACYAPRKTNCDTSRNLLEENIGHIPLRPMPMRFLSGCAHSSIGM